MNFIKGIYSKFKRFISLKQFDKKEGITYDSKASKLLQTSIEHRVLVALPYTSSNEIELRGIGKTTELIRAALKYDATIIVGYKSQENQLRDYAHSLGLKVNVRSPYGALSVRGTRLPGGKFLVDEGVSSEIISELLKGRNELLGGFVRLGS